MLTWQQTEYLLKGVYLGLLVMIAWMVPTPTELAFIGLYTLAGLALFLGVAGVRKIREGYKVKGRWVGFLIFMLLENSGMVYAGLLIGLSFGSGLTFKQRDLQNPDQVVPLEAVWPVLGGAVLGGIFYALGHVRQRMQRFWISLAMIAILIGGAAAFYFYRQDLLRDKLESIGWLLLLGIPGFYLLTFSGLVDESEVEIAAISAALGIGLWALFQARGVAVGAVVVLLPLGLYFVYVVRVLPGLRVFKHALRGISYRQLGQTRLALISLGHALHLDPRNRLARQQLWDIHRDLDFSQLKNEPDILPFLNFEFCLGRISQLLATKPNPDDLRETYKMLDLITRERPALAPICAYWRAVAHLHERNYDDAGKQLASILELPQMHTAERQIVHFSAWNLTIFGHPEMARRVGNALLPRPGQRMDAIAAVETQLAKTPDDPTAWDMKRQLYSDLTEREYWSIAQPDQPLPPFNHEYTQQLGLALLDHPQQWQRGCEYLRIAAHGLKLQSANLYIQIAKTHEKHGDTNGLWTNYLKAMHIGRAIGVDNLAPADKAALLATVKKIGEQAMAQNEIDTALEAYKFYCQTDLADIETYRTLAELFERKAAKSGPGDAENNIWLALHCTENGLAFSAHDKDLQARKDRYYYSITPEALSARLENVRKWFDPQYCRDKARWMLERFNGDTELLDWGWHLTALALIAQPVSHAARLLKARICRLRGEIPDTIALLEEIRTHRPEKFANEEEQKAWYYAHRLLGDLYLDEKPADAVACFLEFRKSDEAGADTSYKMGRAYEAINDFPHAVECYEEVTGYERHPLYHDARDGIDRIRRGAPSGRVG